MIRRLKVSDRVFSLHSEGRVSKLVSNSTVRIEWQGIGGLDMPLSLLSWDSKCKVWEIKQGREYV